MDNQEKLITSGTQDTGQRQTKQKTQHRKLTSSRLRICQTGISLNSKMRM
jgi:hypothetical protein